MTDTMIKLLIVDDSALMRRHLNLMFQTEGDFLICQAHNGKEADEVNLTFKPDVVILDVNMPEMDGLTALSLMMAKRPVPVIMFSSLTEKSALATFEALQLGALDYVTKPGGTISLSVDTIRRELVEKVRAAAKAGIKKGAPQRMIRQRDGNPEQQQHPTVASRHAVNRKGLVIVGVSTGGPRTLEEILPQLPSDFPWPILVAQHMPASFTSPFADRLNDLCPLTVTEAARPMPVEPGMIYIGKGGADMLLCMRNGILTVLPKPEDRNFLWHPSVELLGRSALDCCNPEEVVAVMLTGMGNDGVNAFTQVKKRGGRTIAESEDSAVVFGMPAELINSGGATTVLHSDKIARQLKVWAGMLEITKQPSLRHHG